MDLRRTDLDSLKRLGSLWKTTPGAEFEAMLTDLDLTGWQDAVQYLRSLGMREAPQLVKLNICLSNNIRLTLEGAGVIQAYCRDNRIGDKPFVAMLKEPIADAEPVALGSYSAKAKLKRETPLAADDARVKEALSRWDQLGKHFRNIQRFEFTAPNGIPIRFDLSIVRENAGKPARTFQEARVTTQPPRYEAEVELTGTRDTVTAEKAMSHVIRGLSWLLQGRQRSFVLVTEKATTYVLASLGRIFNGGGANRSRAPFRYPGPQPATLERANMTADMIPGTPNLRTGYNVTDKADGLRCILFVAENGTLFLVDGGGRVYATGKQVDPTGVAGVVLDGEWIRRDRKGATVSHYYAFDILAAAGGDTKITTQPFMIAGAMLGSAAAATTRHTVMSSYVKLLRNAAQTVRGVPATNNLQVSIKSFRAAAAGTDIFQACAAATLEDAKSAPYNTDGLIFTPNAAPLPLGRGTWYDQLKWKPPHENTIDFLVVVEKERDTKGAVLAADAIGTKYREDSGQTVRYKTLRLFVGSNRDGAFADPRITVLDTAEPLPRSLDEGEWREVEFRPVDPRDRMASICYVAVDGEGDLIKATTTGDVIQSDMIVEMSYSPERAPGWRWTPTRVRHDKTERWLAQQSKGGRKGGTMNADWVANSIWNTLHNPVTEDAVRTGRVEHCVPTVAAIVGASSRRADLVKTQCMRNFHDYVKRFLLRRTLAAGNTVCDLAMGTGEEIGKWLATPVSFAFGCDVTSAAINDRDDGAYRRLLNKMVELGGRDSLPPMTFVQADVARSLKSGEAGATPEDVSLLQKVFGAGGPLTAGADVTTCFFSMAYLFRDENTVAGFLTNLADTVKVGGYFVGCGLDGDAVARVLAGGEQSAIGRDGRSDTWLLTKRYGTGISASVPPTAAGLGLAVDVELIAGGVEHTEYLVSWDYLQSLMATCGLELLTAEELVTLGLPASTQMFRDTWLAAEGAGDVFAMSDSLKRLSYMNRWFIFKRRSDRRPAPPREPPAPPTGLTERIFPTASEAAVTGLNSASSAPRQLSRIPESSIDVIELEEATGPQQTESKRYQQTESKRYQQTESKGYQQTESKGSQVITESKVPQPVISESKGPQQVVTETKVPQPVISESKIPQQIVSELPPTDTNTKQYFINPTIKGPDQRLGPDFSDWPAYMTLGTLATVSDATDTTVKYPSVEAAIASAKYQLMVKAQGLTDKTDLGAQLFRLEGSIHQKFEKNRAKSSSPEEIAKSVDDEMTKVRVMSGKAAMATYGVTWDKDLWETKEGRDTAYPAYLAKRYEMDARFRAMIDTIKTKGGEILYVNGTEPTYLGVGVRADGSVAGGDNMLGKWMMSLG